MSCINAVVVLRQCSESFFARRVTRSPQRLLFECDARLSAETPALTLALGDCLSEQATSLTSTAYIGNLGQIPPGEVINMLDPAKVSRWRCRVFLGPGSMQFISTCPIGSWSTHATKFLDKLFTPAG